MSESNTLTKKGTFPIVGIGASAGGLEALQEFFDRISPKTGMAFVIIQHLSPDFESLMEELLSKRTKMRVQKVDSPTEVKPNHVYLLPRRKDLIIEGRTLQPLERESQVKLSLPIDMFFNSLGKEVKENSVAVILSGSGTDGSRGARTVKENGGIIFVQSPSSAQFDIMPNAVITLNIADNILRPVEIANELNRIFGTGGQSTNGIGTSNEFNDILPEILEKVKETSNVDFRLYRQQTLSRRIEKRMSINGVKSPQQYLDYLHNNQGEATVLFYEFLIGVTSFFRDRQAFESLERYVIPELFKKKSPHDKVRIWIAGCSTGEEPYTVAILLSEYIEKNELDCDFKIFASDVNKHSIDFASQGIYYSNIAGDMSPKRLENSFVPAGSTTYQIKKKIREKIVFTVHDITKDPPFIRVDLVICRNMLIYFTPAVQKKLLINFHFALNNDGYLFLGPSESVGGLKNAFAVIDSNWNIFKNVLDVKIAPRRIDHEFKQREPRARVKPYVQNMVKEQYFSNRASDYFSNILIKEFSPICLFITKNLDIMYINGELEQIMKFPQRLADLNIRNMTGSEESLLFRDGIRKVDAEGKTVFYKDIVFSKGETSYLMDLRFKKYHIKETQMDAYLVEIYLKGQAAKEIAQSEVTEELYRDERLKTLEIELNEARQESQALVEQLETANEELQASNEELLAANEELQSTNEELQSVNEELYTVNTELQTKIEELTTVNNDIDNLLKSTAIGTIFLDDRFRIRKFTPAIEEQFNLVETDIGRPINNFTTNFDDRNVYEDAQKVLKTLRPLEREVVTTNEGKTFLMRILPYRTAENIIEGVVLTFVDIQEIVVARQEIMDFSKSLETKVAERTMELKKSNEELARANSYLDSFVFATAHDLRSPVLNLKSFTQLIKRVDSMEQKEEIVEQIGDAAERLSQTLDGLIEMVDFQKNNERTSQLLSFKDILTAVKSDLKPQIQECTPAPSFKVDFKAKKIEYIPAFLYSIIYNLVNNAIKYRDFERPLKVGISTEIFDNYTALHVEDNGIGIDLEEYGDQLFKPFKRLNIEREGRGIGLSLINEAVAKNGGSIQVKSTPGTGTKFTIYLHHY